MRKAAAGVLLGVGAAAIVLALSAVGALDIAELKLYDWRLRQTEDPGSVHPDIALVLIDDQTLRDMAPAFGRWPWPRVAHSLLFEFLTRGPARVVAFDVGLSEPDLQSTRILGVDWTGEESDRELVRAVRQNGRVIVLGDAVYAGVAEQQNKPAEWNAPPYRLGPAIESRPMLLPPFQALTDAALGIGHNFLPFDSDGPARRMPPFIRIGDKYVPSLGIATALAAGGFKPDEVVLEGRQIRVRDHVIPLVATKVRDSVDSDATHDQLSMLINYRASAESRSYAKYEARFLMMSEDQLQQGQKPELDPAVFKDKIVFIGTSASGAHDVFQTPYGGAAMPGIQVHAAMADSLLSNRFMRPGSDASRLAAVLLAGIAVGLIGTMLSFGAGALGTLVLAAAWTWFTVAMFRDGVWLNLTQPVAVMAIALFGGTAYRYFVEDREKRKVKRLFGRYVSKDVYEQLLQHPDRAELGGKRRDMTVLFSDIRGFTTVTESGQPEDLVAQLNEYFSRMVAIVFRHQGTVDKFVGDMVMALFGAPLDDAKHAEHAAQAAVDMVRELGELNREWAAAGRPQLDIGIGINSGEMIAGNIGSSSIMSYTVIGDNVNLGARLESLNKDYKTRIIISDATRARLTGAYDIQPLGDVIVKGKTRAVAIFEIRVPSPLPEGTAAGTRAAAASGAT